MNSQTFEDILHTHGDFILRLCYTYTKDWQMAEDLTQDTFLRFYGAQEQFRHEADVRTYLYRIAVNRCKSYLASWRHKQTQLIELGQKLIAREDVALQVERKDESKRVYKEIEKLPVKYREVLVFYHYFDWTTAQIADLFGCSENTVKTRLRRGRQQLGQLLKKGGVLDEFNY
ncbi:sigma-70 family RNA polymerase sigma factor [Solibacillus sp. A46]|uniref:Sigma-70 family RNA polymerase sigma factor n=1 Tax=Solibacillus faecavium TaxID=2762221 RepID=A0ABR8Y320_9BACL|nr:sigma-70 family RNA polymerase sigma factor [Solibacillus faecavium]MBD8038547.1 sigma-70 family RNA polymerase sigma factor [Solibacillus faecavium]